MCRRGENWKKAEKKSMDFFFWWFSVKLYIAGMGTEGGEEELFVLATTGSVKVRDAFLQSRGASGRASSPKHPLRKKQAASGIHPWRTSRSKGEG